MPTRVYILEKSERLTELRLLLVVQAKGELLTEWDGGVAPDENGLILAHRSDFREKTKQELISAAKKGSVSVCYTDGDINPESTQYATGCYIEIRWADLDQVLKRLSAPFELDEFRSAVDAVRKRDLLNAVAILSRCASLTNIPHVSKSAQDRWKCEPSKWREALTAYQQDDLRIASGLKLGTTPYPPELSEVEALSRWLWRDPSLTSVDAPDFSKLVSQLETKFGVST